MSLDSDNPRNTWSDLLSELHASLEDHKPVSVEITKESDFHRAFDELYIRHKQIDRQRSLARFLRLHDQIIAFVGALDDAIGLQGPHTINSIFWSFAFLTTDAALKLGSIHPLFVEYLPRLNKGLPTFGAQLSLFPDVHLVQRPLQDFFKDYIDCYLVMLVQFASQPTSASAEAFDVRVSSARFDEYKSEWEEMVRKAAEEQKLVHSTPSVPTGSHGPLYPYATRVSFQWIEFLGQGANGHVSKVKDATGAMYAQKIIRVKEAQYRSHTKKTVMNEVAIMQKLRHHHIASVQFATYDDESDVFSMIMLPIADHDLQRFLQKEYIDKRFPKVEISRLTSWFGCLVSALEFAHAAEIKHEDIKPTNILIKDHQPYLADFGCAQDFSHLDDSTSADVLAFGTPVYRAPEPPPRGRKADVFSLGCVFSEMLTVRQGRTLGEYQQHRYLANRDDGYAFRKNLRRVHEWLDGLASPGNSIAALLVEQTKAMLSEDKEERPTARIIKRNLRPEGDTVFCNTCY